MLLTFIFLVGKIFEVKRLLKILSANRKFITAFVGLYAAYTVGYGHGTDQVKNNPGQFSLVAEQKQVAQAEGLTSGGGNENVLGTTTSSDLAEIQASDKEESSGSEQSGDSTNTTSTSSSSAQGGISASSPSPSPKSSSVPTPKATSSASSFPSLSPKTINADGKYSYMGQDITYALTFKNTGGPVTGTVGGACKGTIEGTFDGKDEGIVSGTVKGSCGVGFISKKLDATFSGKVFLTKGIVNLTIHGEIPFVDGDQSFSLSFIP
jgi:hypothetical protein